jgi:hypothetical protein
MSCTIPLGGRGGRCTLARCRNHVPSECSDNTWLVRCKITKGLLSIQSWPRASLDTKLKLYNMAEIVKEIHEQVPLVQRVFDIVEDKGALLVCSEFCAHGSLWDALQHCLKIDHIPWLVCEVWCTSAPAEPD